MNQLALNFIEDILETFVKHLPIIEKYRKRYLKQKE